MARSGQWEDLVVGQEGGLLVIGAGYQLVQGDKVTFVGQRPDGTEFGGNCAIGTEELWWIKETFIPGWYAVYVIREGDLSGPGGYNGRLDVVPKAGFVPIVPRAGYVPNVQFTVLP